MIKKRGSSHIEIVLSFAIFVVFIILLLAIFNPFSKPRLSKNNIDVFESELMNKVNVNVLTTGVLIKKDITKDCFKFNSKQKLEDVKVKRQSDGTFMEVKTDTGNTIKVKSKEKGFYYLFASKDFLPADAVMTGCQELNENDDDYVLSNVREQSVVSENKMKVLIEELSDDAKYASTKTAFGIPTSNDIALRIWLSDKSYDDTVFNFDKYEKTRLNKREVLSRNIPIQIVNDTAEFKYAVMNIQVW